jgi:predicted RNase H-like nuclease (RuvC/YqgF family)
MKNRIGVILGVAMLGASCLAGSADKAQATTQDAVKPAQATTSGANADIQKMRTLRDEQRQLYRAIRKKEMELSKSNNEVQKKLAEIGQQTKELQLKIRALQQSRSEVFKQADPQISAQYERLDALQQELATLRRSGAGNRQRPARGNLTPGQSLNRRQLTIPAAQSNETAK